MMWAMRYLVALATLGVGDAIWLSYFAHSIFRPTLGDILLDDPRWPVVVTFYLFYAAGVLIFATRPALEGRSSRTALLFGALFGFFAYGTYDLTNFATIRAWTVPLAILDTAWGMFLTSLAASASYAISRRS